MTAPQGTPPVRPREVVSWAMFDFANSGYTTLVVTVAFSVYFTKLVAPGESADYWWGRALQISNFLVLLLSLPIGLMADETGRKKWFLAGTYILCVAGTAALWWVTPGLAILGVVLFVISNIGFSLGENLASSFLPEISTPATIGRISGFGWGLGYLGGLACLALTWPLLSSGLVLENLPHLRLIWPVTAAFFLVAALPTFLFLRERAPRGPMRSPVSYVRGSFARLWTTVLSLRHFAELAKFLPIFFVCSCGLATVIGFASIYAERTIGFGPGELIGLFMALQLSAAGGAVLFGWIQDSIGARRTIQITLALWVLVSAGAALASTKALFWAVAMCAGLGIGSLQAASRALVGLFSPVSKNGEFFAFWGLAGKGAFIVGPYVFGWISSATGSQRLAIGANAAFFVVALIAMFWVDERRGRAAAEAWSEGGPREGTGEAT